MKSTHSYSQGETNVADTFSLSAHVSPPTFRRHHILHRLPKILPNTLTTSLSPFNGSPTPPTKLEYEIFGRQPRPSAACLLLSVKRGHRKGFWFGGLGLVQAASLLWCFPGLPMCTFRSGTWLLHPGLYIFPELTLAFQLNFLTRALLQNCLV